MIDGTLFPVAFAPTVNAEDYYTRKGDYAIKGLVICDDAVMITWIEVGWPGSVHNSAFSTSAVMIPAFKKDHISNLSKEKRFFRTKLANICIKSEHCIGLFKAQFQCLWSFRQVIHDKLDLDAILKLTLCACILHNLLIEHPVPPDWFNDDIENLEQDDELNHSLENSSSDTRCNQVFAYMLEGH